MAQHVDIILQTVTNVWPFCENTVCPDPIWKPVICVNVCMHMYIYIYIYNVSDNTYVYTYKIISHYIILDHTISHDVIYDMILYHNIISYIYIYRERERQNNILHGHSPRREGHTWRMRRPTRHGRFPRQEDSGDALDSDAHNL